ncbi:MAG: transaldolase [Chitinispirillales bacterium]|jgi:transaldolase|nr:transaldolase [Chitinispirillales bacterium]
MTLLEQLKKNTTIVEDTGDIDTIKKHKPQDATTNPSLLLQAAKLVQYRNLISNALETSKDNCENLLDSMRPILEKLSVNFAKEILAIIPGRCSVEIDPTLSFDTENTIFSAKRLISLFEKDGISRKRVLIKIAATWEGINAARRLEKENIHCNLTLLFSFAQAVACAEAKVKLISPFVGRILDWYKKAENVDSYPAAMDPGVLSVGKIYNYYKKFDYKTEIMGASFRNIGEITELAGCDLLTIAPNFIEELSTTQGNLQPKLSESAAKNSSIEKISIDEKTFRWLHNEDAMATEKLAEGIRKFTADLTTLAKFLN